ncbi:uncharacterized protein LOC141537215 isoform X1 [Cotesia typhae]|uniref:uncharacterized protein LOC141537215 isoform X1 n=2 Tax=Cotesia typhae TaxID=2053667 RepID=UPI003D69BD29
MGKLCSVKSCSSGRKLKNNGIDISQPLSFFAQQYTLEKLNKWNTALGTTMKTSDYICHLHFKEEDIKMYETFNINGEITIFPTGKKTLRDAALPTVEHQFLPVAIHDVEGNVINQLQKPSSNHNKSEEKLKHEDKSKQQELLADQRVSDRVMDMITQSKHDLEIVQLNEETHTDQQNDKEPEVTSQPTEKFFDNLKSSVLPQGWMYFEKPEGLEFFRMDAKTMQIVNRLRVNKDLSVTVIFSTNEELTTNDNIFSFKTIYEYLKFVEKWPLCVGTQIDKKKFSQTCKGVIFGDESYTRNQANPRCKSCRVLRHRLQNCNSASNILENTISQKRRTSNLQKRCKRLKISKMKLREKVYQAKFECSQKSKVAVNKAIMKLPKTFQSVVNSCFDVAQKKNCKGRRYTLEWIYECILIRIKSRRTYQFLRTRDILPLPCIETLNKFIRKISSSAYGFQPAIFQGLQQKCESMDKCQKRGVLLVDEMKLSEGVYFDSQEMK